MSRVNTLQLPDHAGYLLEFEHPRTGATTIETYASPAAPVARAGHASGLPDRDLVLGRARAAQEVVRSDMTQQRHSPAPGRLVPSTFIHSA
jgi:hypothetical protein